MERLLRGAPHVLVLGGGGVLGEAWMSGVLAGMLASGGPDPRDCRGFVGTSAGSIVAAALTAGMAPEALLRDGRNGAARARSRTDEGAGPGRVGGSRDEQRQEGWSGALTDALVGAVDAARGLGGAAAAPVASIAISTTAFGGALLRAAALRGVRPGTRSLEELRRAVERSRARWDGRLLIAAVEARSGRRVMFGSPAAPAVSVATAVLASCAIPGVFEPVRADGRTYVDGGVWSPTNMDAASVSRGDRVLCLNPTGSLRASMGAFAGAVGPFSRGVSRGEALALRHRGADVATIRPDRHVAEAMGANLMDPRRRGEVIDAALEQGARLAAAL
jgi:NTE family protein